LLLIIGAVVIVGLIAFLVMHHRSEAAKGTAK
jgi:hypothetical protein